ncbi:MAG: N-acetyltransferase [Candidatus Rokuibacteriota bacterium]
MARSAAVSIRPIEMGRRKELKAFVNFPWKIYRDDPNWVPPLIFEQLQFFTPGRNPYLAHSAAQLYMAFRGDEPVGRISAHENNQHIRAHQDGAGFFGFFECIDDQAVASGLLDVAATWLAQRGLKVMRGPLSFSMHHEAGLLLDAFDEPPRIRMTYNPPYYPALLEGHGLQKAQDLFAYVMLESEDIPERLRAIADRVLEDPRLVIRTVNIRDFKNEMERIRTIYAEAWSENWGAAPLTEEEFDWIVGEFRMIYDRDLFFIAEYDGEPAGLSFVLPDMNQALRKAGGRLFPLGLLKILWHRRKIDAWRMPVLGVRREHRLRGIEVALCCRTCDVVRTKRNYRKGEMSWILESNTAANAVLRKLGARRSKTYRIYETALG